MNRVSFGRHTCPLAFSTQDLFLVSRQLFGLGRRCPVACLAGTNSKVQLDKSEDFQ